MFSIDDRTGNILTTVALFAVAAAILYIARGAFFILLLSLFFAYLLEPAVTLVQRHPRLGRKNRTWAIAQVYLIGILVVGSLGYAFSPHITAQMKSLNELVPGILEDLSSGRAGATPGGNALSAALRGWLQDQLARHHDLVASLFERSAASVAYVVSRAVWLFAVPILAIFFFARRTSGCRCLYRGR